MNTIGIACGLEREARHFGKVGPSGITVLSDHSLVGFAGIGEDAAAHTARALVDAGASALVSWGMAGGLAPTLTAGSICIPQEVIASTGEVISTTPYWHSNVARELKARHGVSDGRLLSSPRVIASAADKARTFRETGAVAVDMESLGVGRVALTCDLPFLVLRVIVDVASDAVPTSAIAVANNANPLRVAAALLRAPEELMALCRLALRYRAARSTLASLARVFP